MINYSDTPIYRAPTVWLSKLWWHARYISLYCIFLFFFDVSHIYVSQFIIIYIYLYIYIYILYILYIYMFIYIYIYVCVCVLFCFARCMYLQTRQNVTLNLRHIALIRQLLYRWLKTSFVWNKNRRLKINYWSKTSQLQRVL